MISNWSVIQFDEHNQIKSFMYCTWNDRPLMVGLNVNVLQAIMRQIDNSVKSMGQGSEELLKLLEECPQGAESFVARIVHLLTERGIYSIHNI